MPAGPALAPAPGMEGHGLAPSQRPILLAENAAFGMLPAVSSGTRNLRRLSTALRQDGDRRAGGPGSKAASEEESEVPADASQGPATSHGVPGQEAQLAEARGQVLKGLQQALAALQTYPAGAGACGAEPRGAAFCKQVQALLVAIAGCMGHGEPLGQAATTPIEPQKALPGPSGGGPLASSRQRSSITQQLRSELVAELRGLAAAAARRLGVVM